MTSLHHVQFCCGSVSPLLQLLVGGLGFRRLAGRRTALCQHWVVGSGAATLLLTQRHSPLQQPSASRDNRFLNGEPWAVFCCDGSLSPPSSSSTLSSSSGSSCRSAHHRDSAHSAALRVVDVSAAAGRAAAAGGRVLQSPVLVADGDGQVEYAVVAPPVGGFVHTLIDQRHYRGPFLPGFHHCTPSSAPSDQPVSVDDGGAEGGAAAAAPQFTDHVTVACQRGEAAVLQRWYEQVLGARRFRLNRAESVAKGLEIGGRVQMALRALEYCVSDSVTPRATTRSSISVSSSSSSTSSATTTSSSSSTSAFSDHQSGEGRTVGADGEVAAVRTPVFSSVQVDSLQSGATQGCTNDSSQQCSSETDHNHSSPIKLVIAESLHDESHVAEFVRQFGSAGVQHLALHCLSAPAAVSRLAATGYAQLRVPPPGYYRRARVQQLLALAQLSPAERSRCEQLGLLVDVEPTPAAAAAPAGAAAAAGDSQHSRCLLQVFTKPIFREGTFFLEVIERRGARGFGQGNIEALADSIVHQQMEPPAEQQPEVLNANCHVLQKVH